MKRWFATTCLAFVASAFLTSCGSEDGTAPATSTQKNIASRIRQKEEVVALLRQGLKDYAAETKRIKGRGSHLGQLLGHKFWYRRYPSTYARERLVAKGSSVVPLLHEITRDTQYADVHDAAWVRLATFEDPSVLEGLYEAALAKRLTPADVSGLIRVHLPVRVSADYLHEDKIVQWLGAQLAGKMYDQIRLDLLDDLLKAPFANGGLYPGVWDHRVVRWLDRFYDIDFDSWLAENLPDAWKFRHEQLAKGYDPVIAFSSLGDEIGDGMAQQALEVIFSKPEDQKACHQLLEAAYGRYSPLERLGTDGCEERLRKWYWSQRQHLKYDFSQLKFVPAVDTASSQPEPDT